MALALFASCSTYQQFGQYEDPSDYYTREYAGVHRADIVSELGAPDRETPDGQGGVILVYEKYRGSSYMYSWGYMDYDINKKFIQFFMDNSDHCYRVYTNYQTPASQRQVSGAQGVITGVTVGTAIFATLLFLLPNRSYSGWYYY